MEVFAVRQISIFLTSPGRFCVDGEFYDHRGEVHVKVRPAAIPLLVGREDTDNASLEPVN